MNLWVSALMGGAYLRRKRSWFSVLVLLSALSLQPLDAKTEAALPTRQSEEFIPLPAGVSVEGRLAGAERRIYQLTTDGDRCLKIVVQQRGVDVSLTLSDQNGTSLATSESGGGSQGLETILWRSQTNASYQLELKAREKDAAAGEYEIRLDVVETTPDALVAFQNQIEAKRLLAQRTKEKVDQAQRLLEDSLPAWRKLNDRQMEALTLMRLGNIALSTLFEKPEADPELFGSYFLRSLQILRDLGMKPEEARVLTILGTTYKALGNNAQGRQYLLQALELRDYLSPTSALHLLIGIGDSYWRGGDASKGLEYLSIARSTARDRGDRWMELSSVVKISELYLESDEMVKSAEQVEAGLALARELKAFNYEGILLSLQGRLHLLAGEEDEALELFRQSLELHQKPKVGNKLNAADRQMDIARISLSRGDVDGALERYNAALATFQAAAIVDGEAIASSGIGVALSQRGEYAKALDFLNRALQIDRTTGNRLEEVSTMLHLSDVLEQSGDRGNAIKLLEDTLSLCQKIQYYQGESTALVKLAHINRVSGNLDKARQLFESARVILEDRRSRFGVQQWKESFGASLQSCYQEYIDLLMELHSRHPDAGNDRLAYSISENARARGLLDLLAESHADIRSGAEPALIQKEHDLAHRLVAKDAARRRLLQSKTTEAQAGSLSGEIEALSRELQLVEARIRDSSPRYAALIRPQPLSASDTERRLLDDDTVLLEYSLGEQRSWLWAVTRSSLDSYELPPRAQIETLARRVYQLLTSRQPRRDLTDEQQAALIDKADKEFQIEAAAISKIALGHLAPRLQKEWKDKRLVIVASGALQYIPFGALPVPWETAYRPLIADHEVVNLPSASVLAAIRTQFSARRTEMKTLAILADPVFDKNDSRVVLAARRRGSRFRNAVRSADQSPGPSSESNAELRRSVRSFDSSIREGFSRLPFSREEAEGIAAMIPRGRLVKATDFEASLATATSGELSNYRIVHFATHGLLNSAHPELSGLVLSLVDESGKPQDGFLRMQEIYNLNLPADLVVLSACQTALGKEIRGEGLIGLTRGFMYAGAQRVVASLWQVDDLGTAKLMESFYGKMLKDGLPAASALRAAQLDLSRQKRWSSPYFWAAFILQGEWR